MIGFDEEALMCDLAEVYHIFDYKQLPAQKVAVFSIGLRDNSRIKLKMSGQNISFETTLLAGITDKLSVLIWSKTKDAQKGANKPKLILNELNKTNQSDDKEMVFNSGEEFDKYRAQLLNGGD
ncbi:MULTISPECIES: DUF5361 domain-containing protein [unclassified Lactococcus]|uniref:DUF5361 domain-containing protein n=1 Tax=unclassified Lactococcus TaxID=2643510 RepID=UPI0011CBBCF4|nr:MULTISPECIES: DUF5361 domain-containing protein [unclassified Lactococcus]MQW23885.1 hypothetical protein [Lactococcus sp. dk101]TXK37115.1 hypothetical protein FVP42_09695 [Lactococcus sp. dk310]TXK47970.1 hypothetical protein FVP43_09420 [Lactococcus sp. dk322]